MKHYLTIIRKVDFVDLFKYGHLYVYQSKSFSGDIYKLKLEDFTKTVNPFEYSFEYLIVHFALEKPSRERIKDVNISDVQAIYVFNEEARREMYSSFDPRIKIHVFPHSELLGQLQQELSIKQGFQGIDNLWKIFRLSQEDKEKCKEIITDDIAKEVFHEFYANERLTGDKSLWVYLLRYERHSLYTKNTKGFFCDCIHVIFNWGRKKECVEEIPNIDELRESAKFPELSDSLIKSPRLREKIEEINKEVNCKFHIVAPLFLLLKSTFSEGIDTRKVINGSSYENFMKHCQDWGFEFALATYLLGLVLGQDKTYDSYYNEIDLPIFKDMKAEKERQNEQKEINFEDEQSKSY